jgi:transcriptional regulator with XRE-family HTH domain
MPMEAKDFIAALVERGLTQSQIAERTGIAQPTLSKVARGEVADVLSRNYRKLQALHDEVVRGAPPVESAAAADEITSQDDADTVTRIARKVLRDGPGTQREGR